MKQLKAFINTPEGIYPINLAGLLYAGWGLLTVGVWHVIF